ncbi:MAG: TIGR00730 family Rossman fold protein [Oxalobacter sp.]|nr:TIGR00730 family Rossman fold protein [Oxalobacter sp.]
MLRSICVYCGSRMGNSEIHADAARALAQEMVNDNIALVYGGAHVGLMGILADEVLRLGGEVTGVIPKDLLEKEVGHDGLTRLYIVKDMHERKAMMAELADGFITLSGGMGTLDELFETFTWSMLGVHEKPIGILNIDGFYDNLIGLIDHLVDQGFVDTRYADMLFTAADPKTLVTKLRDASAPEEIESKASARFLI